MEERKPIATRLAAGIALAEIGEDKNIYVLDADLSGSTMTCKFRDKYPERHINCGIAEGNMMSTAAGIASTGKKVFAASFAMFASGRAFEQIRNSICYPELNVCVIGTHAGVTVGEDGATHQCLEDVSLMRTIPNMTVVCPSDGVEAAAAVRAIAKHNGPVYLRCARLPMPYIFDEKEYGDFEIGKGRILNEGIDITIIASGLLLHESIKAAAELEKDGYSVRLVDMPTIKPIDKDLIIDSAKKTGCILAVEESSIYGGLGSAVSEVLCANYPTLQETVGIADTFGISGKPYQLLDHFGLSAPHIKERAITLIKRK